MFKDKIKKIKLFIWGNILFATILGIYAQNITYHIVGDSLARDSLLFWLTILTITSIVLFLATPILIYNVINKSKIKKQIFVPHLIANYAIGISTSIFSIFVLVMSWG